MDKYNPFRIRMGDVWSRARKTRVCGVDTLTLGLEDLLVYECLHVSFQHVFLSAAFRDLFDVSQIVKLFLDEIDWNLLVETCVEWKTEAFVYYTLNLAGRMFDTPAPQNILNNLEGKCNRIHPLGLKSISEYDILGIKKLGHVEMMKFVLLELLWTAGIRDKIRISQRVISNMPRMT